MQIPGFAVVISVVTFSVLIVLEPIVVCSVSVVVVVVVNPDVDEEVLTDDTVTLVGDSLDPKPFCKNE